MRDLRALDIQDRRALALEAERRAWAGESPAAICAAMGLSLSTYYRWAALFGFRLSDREPGHKMGRAITLPGAETLARQPGEAGSVSRSASAHMNRAAGAVSDPALSTSCTRDEAGSVSRSASAHMNQAAGADPSSHSESRYPSGRFMLRQGLGGRVPGSGRKPREDLKAMAAALSNEAMLEAVYRLREAQDWGELDRLLSAWKTARRRERLIGELESSVQGFAEVERPIGANGQPMRTLAEIEAMSDADLLDFVLSQVPEHTRVGPVFEGESAAGCN
ncbi:MAG: helix-turn-helix domain-containing protein [Pseudomonadota bacterium]